jgi:galactonate dehydratase
VLIHELELFTVPPRWLFVKITDSEGVNGWGEPIVEGRAATVATAVEELGEYLLGAPVGAIEDIWQLLYRGGFYRGGPILSSAISGIEQALWDIKGKRLGVPIYELLGGPVRDKMRMYGWVEGFTPEAVRASAQAQVAAGYRALKMDGTMALEWLDSHAKVQFVSDQFAVIREAVGYDVEVAVDFHGRAHKAMAKVLVKELEQFRPFFYEEPLLPENNEALAELARLTHVPLATGERIYMRWGFKSLLVEGSVGLIQPDISHAGGIWETRKIAAMAEAFDVAVAPHCPLGPIALAAALQLDFCTPNAFIQEQGLDVHTRRSPGPFDLLTADGGFDYADGFVLRSNRPGLGIEVDEQRVRAAAAIGHRWRSPVWRTEDGAVTEW